ncbi:sigma factor [uncultured Brachybacterium sp.]|uniref:sigma factor n=1 Tax=uncultured Brachybacterium sp. TaxID=189680 RepID=UPI002616AEAA|nr:sigma factor [uncultured Brachybacterium sp.]
MAHDLPESSAERRPPPQPDSGGDLAEGPDAPALPELLSRVARGDEDAFSRLYDDTSSLLFALIKRVVRDVSISEEVLQEVYVEIWKQAPRFDARADPLTAGSAPSPTVAPWIRSAPAPPLAAATPRRGCA